MVEERDDERAGRADLESLAARVGDHVLDEHGRDAPPAQGDRRQRVVGDEEVGLRALEGQLRLAGDGPRPGRRNGRGVG